MRQQEEVMSVTSNKQPSGNNYWHIIRPFAVFFISLGLVCSIVFIGYNYVMNRYIRPVDINNKESVTIEIKRGSSSSAIANLLYGETDSSRLIRSKAAFKIYVDFMGKGSKLQAGLYTLSRAMTIEEIVDVLCVGTTEKQAIIKIRTIEGWNIEQIAKSLVDTGILQDDKQFLELCKSGKDFNFQFAEDNKSERKYMLEGYLFPDTYEVYADSSEQSIINKLLARFNDIYSAQHVEREQELGLTMDQVITLASIIEREGKPQDFKKISAVFHNRLKKEMSLESCATLQYVLNTRRYVLTKDELATESPYNTYKNMGLPVGPICNPGKDAIEAALFPDEAYLDQGYIFFCLKDPATGETAFSKTLDEHNKNVADYKELWLEYDKKVK